MPPPLAHGVTIPRSSSGPRTHTGSRSGGWHSGGGRTVPFCSGGCRSSSQQSCPGRSLGRRHSPASEGGQTSGSPHLKKALPGSGGGQTSPSSTQRGTGEGSQCRHLKGSQARPALPCPSPSQPHPLPARREAAPGAAATRPGAGPGSSPQRPPSPGCPRLSPPPPPPSSQPFRFLRRGHARAPPEAALRRREDWHSMVGEVAEAEVSWGHFRGADVEGRGGGGAEDRGRC